MNGALFTDAVVTSAFLKMGILGFQGSGKTKSATKTAIGLIQYAKKLDLPYANRPVFFIDTETGSDWVLPDFKAAGIPIKTAKTRAFSDLVEAVKLAEQNASVLLVDSVTHFWKELCESYCKRKAQQLGRKNCRLKMSDWGYLKGPDGWGKFADAYVNSPVHIILCGRAGYEFDMTEDEEGHKQLEKTGIKMKAEGEFGFEPSLLVYMERHQQLVGDKVERVWREATVLKDRAAVIDGKSFEDPDFKDFLPHIQRLNLGGAQLGVDTTRSSEHIVSADRKDWSPVQRRIVIDEIQTLLVLHHPGQTAADKKAKIELLRKHFNAVWTEIEEAMSLFDLRAGYDSLHRDLEGKPSRYSQPDPEPVGLDDGLPDCVTAATDPATAGEGMVTTTTPSGEAGGSAGEGVAMTAAPSTQNEPDDGIPPYLRRKPPADVVDEKAWLDRLSVEFADVADFDGFKGKHEALIKPQHERVSPAAWANAVSIAQQALHRVTGVLAA